jgi:hypothetical protein
MMKAASSGLATGPPWTSTITSRLTFSAASAQASTLAGQSASSSTVSAPIEPPVVNPRWQTMISAPALAMAAASSALKT